MRYKTCVSIAERTLDGMKKGSRLALKRSDYVEMRLDFLNTGQIPEALEAVKGDLDRIVCTLRPKAEGGRFPGTEKERVAILKLVAEYNPFLLDVEFNTLKRDAALRKYLKSARTDLLVSWHDFKRTPSSAELAKKMSQMGRFSSNVKIVGTARTASDSNRMLELYSRKGRNSLISFAMGDLGRASRILCLYLGSPYTYVSLGKPVAPGQFSIDEVRRITGTKDKQAKS